MYGGVPPLKTLKQFQRVTFSVCRCEWLTDVSLFSFCLDHWHDKHLPIVIECREEFPMLMAPQWGSVTSWPGSESWGRLNPVCHLCLPRWHWIHSVTPGHLSWGTWYPVVSLCSTSHREIASFYGKVKYAVISLVQRQITMARREIRIYCDNNELHQRSEGNSVPC